MQLGRLQTVDLLYLQSLLDYLQVTLVTLNIIQSLVNVLLVPQIPTISQSEYLHVLLTGFALFLFGVATEVGDFGVDDDAHVLDLVGDLEVAGTLGDGFEGDFV